MKVNDEHFNRMEGWTDGGKKEKLTVRDREQCHGLLFPGAEVNQGASMNYPPLWRFSKSSVLLWHY